MELCVAMLLFRLRKIQKSRKAFLKRLSETCLLRQKICSQQKKWLSQDEEKVFSEKKLFYFLEYAHVKKKKRNAFLPTQQKSEILCII